MNKLLISEEKTSYLPLWGKIFLSHCRLGGETKNGEKMWLSKYQRQETYVSPRWNDPYQRLQTSLLGKSISGVLIEERSRRRRWRRSPTTEDPRWKLSSPRTTVNVKVGWTLWWHINRINVLTSVTVVRRTLPHNWDVKGTCNVRESQSPDPSIRRPVGGSKTHRWERFNKEELPVL